MKLLKIASLAALATPVVAQTKVFDPFSIQDASVLAPTLDVLFWQANQDGLPLAAQSSSTTKINGHVVDLDFDWNWGFRAGIDCKIPHDRWDFNTQYAFMHSTAHKSESAAEFGALFSSWQFPQVSGVFVTHAKAHWICNLNMADLELGRNCFIGSYLSLRPFMGVRGAVIQQRFHVNYEGGTAVPAGDEDKIKMSNNFWGVGLRFGGDSLWGLGKGISFYADGAASLISGRTTVHQREHYNRLNTTVFNVSNHKSTVVPILELSLGLQWDYIGNNNGYHVGAKLGWEGMLFFNQNRFMQFSSSSNPGVFSSNNEDLSFQGVTFSLRFDF
jgi:hypothetical protein